MGTLTGLIPGLHINLVAVLALSSASLLQGYLSPVQIAVAIVVMSVTHTFVDFIPSIFLGAPEGETALSVLPGHQMLLRGRGYEALMLTLVGGIFSLISAAVFFPLAIILYPLIFNPANHIIHWLLLAAVLFFILREKEHEKKLSATAVVMLAGCLGLLALEKVNEPLLPLFSGLFGVSTLLSSMMRKTKIPLQRVNAARLPKSWLKSSAIGTLFGGLINLFPALGPAQAATMAGIFVRSTTKSYLLMVGAVNTASMLLALATLHSINRARNGSIEVLSSLAEINLATVATFLAAVLVAAPLIVFVTINIARKSSEVVARMPYRAMCIAVIAVIVAAVSLLSGWKGIIVLATGTAIGLMAISSGISRSHSMASLILPVAIRKF
ncbi:tripartite tricarboxylate transporter permease [Candidatus Woesearchaeota archaeon]|nr:tripartite tricarboxylate transporter permease [Candidatus Woesearchaeota archaeon]